MKKNKMNNIEEVEKRIVQTIKEYKKRTGFKGFNPVWTGLNELLRRLGYEPREVYQKMQEKNLIRIRPMRVNGKSFVLLYLPEDAPSSNSMPDFLRKVWEGL